MWQAFLWSSPYFVKVRASEEPRPPQPINPILMRSLAPNTRAGFILAAVFAKARFAMATPAPKPPLRFRKSRRSNWSADMVVPFLCDTLVTEANARKLPRVFLSPRFPLYKFPALSAGTPAQYYFFGNAVGGGRMASV